jgi:hypothetical protein
VIKLGNKKAEIPQTIGVHEGDNLSPVLFLFLISAFAEALESEWTKKGIIQVEFSRVSSEDFGNSTGQLLGHELSKMGFADGVIFKVLQILYLDDGAFVFASREDMIRGVTLINSLFKSFGLEMHIGKNNKASKTECIFFPPPRFFDQPSIQNTPNAPPMLESVSTPNTAPSNETQSDTTPDIVIGKSPIGAIVEKQKTKERRKKKVLYKQSAKDLREDFYTIKLQKQEELKLMMAMLNSQNTSSTLDPTYHTTWRMTTT